MTKKMDNKFFFPSSFSCCWIRDPDGKQSGCRIRDKHLGSATLLISFSDSFVSEDAGSIPASSDTA